MPDLYIHDHLLGRAPRRPTSTSTVAGTGQGFDTASEVVDEPDKTGEHALGDELEQIGLGQVSVPCLRNDGLIDRPSIEDDCPGECIDGCLDSIAGF